MHRRRDIAVIAAIIFGLLAGHFIKRVTFGLLFGLAVGLLLSSLISNRNRKNQDR